MQPLQCTPGKLTPEDVEFHVRLCLDDLRCAKSRYTKMAMPPEHDSYHPSREYGECGCEPVVIGVLEITDHARRIQARSELQQFLRTGLPPCLERMVKEEIGHQKATTYLLNGVDHLGRLLQLPSKAKLYLSGFRQDEGNGKKSAGSFDRYNDK